ncbi:hypothetical protein [Burkholderia multivorans]|uniref:hypothetical protein n=1 Tax=Burkholderia multivorans TaxID=87883 RepID=UPI0019CF7F65|nr:hypothetical protein [Burkholderia multivorans]MBN6728536.1 hypothetical protein [Burkholderia multivorans]MBR8021226.1 hypothetical protein [Burkholderia multivorans]MBU9489952.1 hypothetical protein [Burkholderia multivorans]HEF4732720.1 hypothetical protein [Burkholderia multivorans]HEM8495360.1 hypothetical protein [Burkholderia multivorans]
MKFESPICAICHRIVDHFEMNHDYVTGRRKFTARCHGETQIQYLDDRDLERLGPDGISIGYAFDLSGYPGAVEPLMIAQPQPGRRAQS